MADDVLCAGCDRPVPDALPLCITCGDSLVAELLTVPGLLADLTITRAGLGKLSTHREGGRSADVALPVRSIARDTAEGEPDDPVGAELHGDRAYARLENAVGTWARLLAEHLRVEIPVGAPGLITLVANGRRGPTAARADIAVVRWTVTDPKTAAKRQRARTAYRHGDTLSEPATALDQAAVWMACHPHELRAHEAAGDMLAEITGATAALRRVIDLPPEMRYLGPCPSVLRDGTVCAAELLAERGAASWVRCRRCREQHDIRAIESAAAAAADNYLYTLAEVLRILTAVGETVPRTTLYRWGREGKIKPRGWLHADSAGIRITDHALNEGDQPVYRLGDVRALARRDQDEGGSAA